MKATEAIPQDVLAKLTASMAALQAALLAKDPLMPRHLRESHQLLISYPESVQLLDDTEVAALIDAAELHTKTEIVKAKAPAAKAGGKKVSADQL